MFIKLAFPLYNLSYFCARYFLNKNGFYEKETFANLSGMFFFDDLWLHNANCE